MSAAPAMTSADQIGKYHVIAELGHGGMARVLLTVASGPAGFEKLLVVKRLREEFAADDEFLVMFLDEARIAARLNHPNVVQTYEVGAEGPVHYIAMDYLEGQPLSGILRKLGRNGLPLELHVRVLADMLAGLDYAHNLIDFDGTPLHVVHRDVSPQNVFVTYDGQVKLVDFGIAKAAVLSRRTKTGVFKGKTAYIAPEQARAHPVDARADVFAAGVMLFEAIAGRAFAQADSELALLAMRMQGLEPRIGEVVPDAPEGLAEICDRAMAHDREGRFASAAEMREALEGWLEQRLARAGQKELAALLTDAFAEERAKLRARINEQLNRLRSGEQTSLTVLDLELVSSVAERTPGLKSSVMVQTKPIKPAGRAWIAALALGGVAAVAVTSLLTRRGEAPTRDRGAAAASAAAEAPGNIDVVLRYSPASATATLDGARIDENPFHGRFPRDGSAHHVEVQAEGFRAERRVFSFDRNHELLIDLVREAGAGAGTVAPGPADASAQPAGKTGIPARGTRKPPTSKPQHEIDERNPYSK
jgi:serine/threonine protein kinase